MALGEDSQELAASFSHALNLLAAVATPGGLGKLREKIGVADAKRHLAEAVTSCLGIVTRAKAQPGQLVLFEDARKSLKQLKEKLDENGPDEEMRAVAGAAVAALLSTSIPNRPRSDS